MTETLTGPTGTAIAVRPIAQDELDRIVLRCWPDRDVLAKLFDEQGTIGMAAWEDDKCVAQLHCYRVVLPDGANAHWPMPYVSADERVFAGWGQWGPKRTELGVTGPVWCNACFHVGRTLLTQDSDVADLRYFGRGIGTALCRASIDWAREHDYAAVIAPGAAHGLPQFTQWYGHLPWTTYDRLGFRKIEIPPDEIDALPGWAKGEVHEPIASEIKAAFDAGRPVHEILERVMVLDLSAD